MWDLPGPGLEPVSPALAGGFLTTAPPGKSQNLLFKSSFRECYGMPLLKLKWSRAVVSHTEYISIKLLDIVF